MTRQRPPQETISRTTGRRAIAWLAAFACATGWSLAGAAPASAGPSILFELQSGRVVESEDAFQRWYPASLTKLMTTYVAFRAVQAGEVTFSSPIRISKRAAKLPPSKMGYKPGAELTLDNALKIIMVKSANDVALAIGESLAGSQQAFAERMNAESRRLGMTDSNWVNPHGLHDDAQYSSPRDLAILTMALRRDFPQYSDYFSIEGLLAGGKEMPSHNNLIGRYEGADGMKTGYTCPSGFNLVASASRGGRTLVAVVLGGETIETRDEKAAVLLTRGFTTAPGTGPLVSELPRAAGEPSQPVNMFGQICSETARKAKAAAAKKLQEDIKAGRAIAKVPLYAGDFGRPRRLVSVKLGGAVGPMSKALEEAQAYADVPIPTWRPDMPPPGVAAADQGDGSARIQ